MSKCSQMQEWFADIITTKLNDNMYIQPITARGQTIEIEAARYIVPSPTLQPHERIEIYNQQYWWRLQNILRTNFPFVMRLVGAYFFERDIAVPYLLAYPPDHWSLHTLGEHLSTWLQDNYFADNRELILNAALLDWAFMKSYIAKQMPYPDLTEKVAHDPNSLLKVRFYLQPHVTLFSWPYDLFDWRKRVLEQEETDIADLSTQVHFRFVFYRTPNNFLTWKQLGATEFLFLQQLSKGTSMEEVCAFIEEQGEAYSDEALEHLQEWMQEWQRMGLLTLNFTD